MEISDYNNQIQHIIYSLFHAIYIKLRSHTIQYIPINHPTAFTLCVLQLRLTHILQCLRCIPTPSRATVSPGIYFCSMDLSTAPVHLRCTFSSMASYLGPQCLQKCTHSNVALLMAAVPAPVSWAYPWPHTLMTTWTTTDSLRCTFYRLICGHNLFRSTP